MIELGARLRQDRHKIWLLLLAAVYVALIPLLAGLEDVQGVTYLLIASAVGCLLVWSATYVPRERLHSRWASLLAPLDMAADTLRRLPLVVLWLPLPVSLSWTAGMMARHWPPWEADYYLAFGIWLVALLLFVAVLLVPLVVENWEKLPALVRAIPLPEVAAVAFITGVAFVVRFVLLADEPGPFWHDEGGFSSLGLEVARGIRENFFFMGFASTVSNMYELTIGLPFKLFGPSIFVARLSHAIVGILTVALSYFTLREMFDRRVAAVGAIFLAVYSFHVHFSRIAFPNLYDTFFAFLILLFAFRAIRTGKYIDFALLGLAAGLQFYFFSGSRILPVMLAILLVYMALKTRGGFVRQNFWGLAILVAGFVVASLPAALYWDGTKTDDTIIGAFTSGTFTSRWEVQNIFDTGWLNEQIELTGRSKLHVLWDQFQQSLGALVVYPDVFQHYNAGIPLLTGVSTVFFVIGGVYGLFHIYQPRFLALFALLLIVVILGGMLLGPPVASQRYLATVPVSVIFVALGVVVVAEAFASLMPKWRSYAPALAAALVLVIAFVDLNFYFGTYLPSDNYGDGRHLHSAQAAGYLETYDESYTVYFLGVGGFHTRAHALLFRNRDKVIVDVFPDGYMANTFVEAVRGAIGEEAAEARNSRPNALFLVPTGPAPERDRSAELRTIKGMCPNGIVSPEITAPMPHNFTYVFYDVVGAQGCVDQLEESGILQATPPGT